MERCANVYGNPPEPRNEVALVIAQIHVANFEGLVTGRVKRRDDLLMCRVRDELLPLDTELGKIHQLNETATFIWDKWEQAPDPVEIAKMIAVEYKLQEGVTLADVSAMVRRLRELNLLVG